MIIKQIEAKDTYTIRHQILRPDMPIQSCQFDGDNDEQTFHLGAYVDDSLVSVASFYLENHNDIPEEYQFRLRGMATLSNERGKGLSTGLLKTAFPLIKSNHVKVVWCNARVSAIEFYKKVGFETVSAEFNIEGIGPHVMMKKIVQ